MEHGVSSFGRPWRRARKPRKRRLERTLLNPRPTILAAAAVIFVVGLAGTGAVAAAVPDRAGGMKPGVARGGFRHVDPNYPFRFRLPNGQLTPVRKLARTRSSQRLRLLSHEPQPGELRYWAGLDIVQGALYPKPFAFRGVGKKIEVWVAPDLEYLPGDCRNGARTTITDAQVQELIRAFDRTIYPRESAVFSVPPSRDGAGALVGPPFHPEGRGDRTVVLVDNVRDESFYDLSNSQDFGYVVGVYSSALEQLFDRNMMTIDAFDWLHRTGRRPPNEPAEGDSCRNAPAYPTLIEGVFAHEYQHLLEHHEDADEVDWLDEGLAEWARSLTGYADPDRPVSELGYDRHTQCFLGNVPDLAGGPENSLTLWGDGGELNCEYGAVYSFMEYVHARFGTRMMTALHRGDANGLAGLQEALGRRVDARDVLHGWAASLAREINWENPFAYGAPGAPPNGADYVLLRDAEGSYLRGRDLRRLTFDGAEAIPGRPVEWTVDAAPPAGGPPALYTGAGNNLDRTIVRSLDVPAGTPELAFQAQWNVEEDPTGGWDFTFVQVSTDGGATYQSIACTSSRSDASPFSRPVMQANVPGFTAYSGGWRNERCGLSAYAGRSILLAFRHVTDGSIPGDPDDPTATIPPGFWLRNVTVAGSPVADGASLAGWLSPSQARPTLVHGFMLQLVGYSSRGRHRVSHARVALDGQHDAALDRRQLRRLLGSQTDLVGAIVMYDEPTEQVTDYAPYRLAVNGVLQPGG
jgi:hypothetical protein